MKSLRLTLIAILSSALLVLGSAGVANAAPPDDRQPAHQRGPDKGAATVSSPLLGLAALLGIEVSPTGLATQTEDGAFEFQVAGNTRATGTLMMVGGIELAKADGSTFTLENTHMDLDTLVVTGVVDGEERIPFFQATQVDADTVSLALTAQGAEALNLFVFGSPTGLLTEGYVFGESSTTAPLP